MIRSFVILTLLTLSTNIAFSQSPYETNWKKELPYLGIGVATIITGKFLINNDPFLTSGELLTLAPNDVNSFDRFAIDNFSARSDKLSDAVLYTSIASPYLLLAGGKSRKHFGKIMLMYGEATAINIGITLMTKSIFKRPRPFALNAVVSDEFKLSHKVKTSFISGHTSITAVNTFFTAKVFAQLYPDSKWKPMVWTLAATIPAVTGTLRVTAGRHYPTDVIAGYALGATIGVLVPHLHRNKEWNDNGLRIDVGVNNASLTWQFAKPKEVLFDFFYL